MRRALPLMLIAALAAGGCARRHRAPAPDIVSVKVAAADMPRFRGYAKACGAISTSTKVIGEATLLIVGADSPLPARDCFFEKAAADYRANHPVRAWIEDRLG